MIPEKTYCLLGSSGVGKTTLINRLMGDSGLATREVSDTGEGRHTTTRRQLIMLEHGGLLIDMPGMRELGMIGVSEGIDESFADIRELFAELSFQRLQSYQRTGLRHPEGHKAPRAQCGALSELPEAQEGIGLSRIILC